MSFGGNSRGNCDLGRANYSELQSYRELHGRFRKAAFVGRVQKGKI